MKDSWEEDQYDWIRNGYMSVLMKWVKDGGKVEDVKLGNFEKFDGMVEEKGGLGYVKVAK
jgi:hypothetical protein